MELNPYESSESDDRALSTGMQDAQLVSRKDMEGAVAILVSTLLAGGWAGLRYQGSGAFLLLVLVTVGVFVGTIGYAIAAKRVRVLLFLPLLVLGVIGQEYVLGLLLFFGVIGVPIAVAVSAARPTRQNWMVAGQMVLLTLAGIASLFLFSWLQELGARGAADRGRAVIEAVDRYQTRKGTTEGNREVPVQDQSPCHAPKGKGPFHGAGGLAGGLEVV